MGIYFGILEDYLLTERGQKISKSRMGMDVGRDLTNWPLILIRDGLRHSAFLRGGAVWVSLAPWIDSIVYVLSAWFPLSCMFLFIREGEFLHCLQRAYSPRPSYIDWFNFCEIARGL